MIPARKFPASDWTWTMVDVADVGSGVGVVSSSVFMVFFSGFDLMKMEIQWI